MLDQLIKDWTTAVGAFLLAWVVLRPLFEGLLRRQIAAWNRATGATWTDLLLKRLRSPSRLFISLAALAIGAQFVPHEIRAHPALAYSFKIALILDAVWSIDRILGVFFRQVPLPAGATGGSDPWA